jgi:hypothetical protein
MTREIEGQLKQMFAQLDEGLPAADFTSQVMSRLHKVRRTERLLLASAVLAVLAFLGFSFFYLESVVGSVAGLSEAVLDGATDSSATLIHSPLVYVYGMAMGGYLLLRLTQRLTIRLP